MPELRGLKDTAPVRKAYIFRTVAELMRHLKKGHACCAANDNGAINVHRDRKGRYRCERMRYMSTQDEQIFTALTHVRTWTSAALKAIK